MANTRAPSTIYIVNLTGQTEFTVPFEYLARKYVTLTLLGTTRQPLTLNVDYRFVSKSVVSLNSVPGSQFTQLEIRRVTSATERLVDFHDGSILRANDLNLSQIQTLHVAQEARDSVNSDSISIDDDFNLDARGKRIVNLGYAQNGGDAVPLGQLVDFENSALNSARASAASAERALLEAERAKGYAEDVQRGGVTYAQIRGYTGDLTQLKCIGETFVFDGRYGDFVVDPSDTTSLDDDILILVDALGRRWKRQYRGPMLPRFAGVVGDGITDDRNACTLLIAAFKQEGVYRDANGGFDMQGRSIDWSGYTCALGDTLLFHGMYNYTMSLPTFRAASNFPQGKALLSVHSNEKYPVSNITWTNPQLDGAWLADYCLTASDFLKFTLQGGLMTHYRKKGLMTSIVKNAPHELILNGTLFFQREWNEVYPADVTEGEAFELNNYDNEINSVVIGYQKRWAATSNLGANRYMGGHVYTGHDSNPLVGAFRALGAEEFFIGTYFDYTCLETLSRVTVSGCDFGVGSAGKAIKFGKVPFLVKVTGCNFFKSVNDTTNNVFQMPTIAEGRTARPVVTGNTFDRCAGFDTNGLLYVTAAGWESKAPIPDYYKPISNHGSPVKVGDSSNAGYSMFTTLLNETSSELTVRSYVLDSSGALKPASGNLSIRLAIPMNV